MENNQANTEEQNNSGSIDSRTSLQLSSTFLMVQTPLTETRKSTQGTHSSENLILNQTP